MTLVALPDVLARQLIGYLHYRSEEAVQFSTSQAKAKLKPSAWACPNRLVEKLAFMHLPSKQ